jgi:hypothetical protein
MFFREFDCNSGSVGVLGSEAFLLYVTRRDLTVMLVTLCFA